MTNLKIEWGTWTEVTTTWTSKTFAQTYTNPRVVISTEYNYTGQTENTIEGEIKNITTTGCEVRFRVVTESGTNTDPEECTIHYIVAEDTGEETDYTLPNTSIKVQVGQIEDTDVDSKSNWSTDGNVTLIPEFSGTPVAFCSRTSHNNAGWVTTWVCETGTQGDPIYVPDGTCHIHFTDCEVPTGDFSSGETIDYIIVEQSSNFSMDMSDDDSTQVTIVLSSDNILGLGNSADGYNIAHSLSTTPAVFVVFQQAMDGGDGGYAFSKTADGTNVKVWSLEDQNDSERNHTSEQVAIFSFEDSGYYDPNPPTPSPTGNFYGIYARRH